MSNGCPQISCDLLGDRADYQAPAAGARGRGPRAGAARGGAGGARGALRSAAETKPLLLARAVEDPEAQPRRAALELLARDFRDATETGKVLQQSATIEHGEFAGYLMMLLARTENDREGAILLSRDLDAQAPGIDPGVLINDERIDEIARNLSWSKEKVRLAYKRLSSRFPLSLSWQASMS